jgi:hypothetical protein
LVTTGRSTPTRVSGQQNVPAGSRDDRARPSPMAMTAHPGSDIARRSRTPHVAIIGRRSRTCAPQGIRSIRLSLRRM